jgi:hypothetical protein
VKKVKREVRREVRSTHHVTKPGFLKRMSQNSKGSKPAQVMTAPPDSSGERMLRTMPPMWKSGIMLRHTSLGVFPGNER